MLRLILPIAGLGAALLFGGQATALPDGAPSAGGGGWVEQRIELAAPGFTYHARACYTVGAPGVSTVRLAIDALRTDAAGSLLLSETVDGPTITGGAEECIEKSLVAPCYTAFVRYGVQAIGDTSLVTVSSLTLTSEEGAAPSCPAPPPPSPTPSPAPAAKPITPGPAPAVPPPEADIEPTAFSALTNGGFEQLRDDGTPYGWHKIGGEMVSSGSVASEGTRSAALVSRTESTKWLYQTLVIRGGTHYRLQAQARADAGVSEAMLRVSWYASADGSGSQLATADSEPVAPSGSRFVPLDTGSVLAPPEARSARVRLLVRPASATKAIAYFDDVRFEPAGAPPPEAATTTGGGSSASGSAVRDASREPSDAPAAPIDERRATWPVANVHDESAAPEPAAEGGSGRPVWPIAVALIVPSIGLAIMGADAWRRSRLDGPN